MVVDLEKSEKEEGRERERANKKGRPPFSFPLNYTQCIII